MIFPQKPTVLRGVAFGALLVNMIQSAMKTSLFACPYFPFFSSLIFPIWGTLELSYQLGKTSLRSEVRDYMNQTRSGSIIIEKNFSKKLEDMFRNISFLSHEVEKFPALIEIRFNLESTN